MTLHPSSVLQAKRARALSTHRHPVAVEFLEWRVLWSATREFFPIGASATFHPLASSSPGGVTPATMRSAYGLTSTLFGSISGDGTGQTIAIIDAYNEPTIVSDLAAFDAKFGLPAPASFTVVNQNGGTTMPSNDSKGGWGLETAMDVEWAHVIAPSASILLVLANSANDADLYKAVDTARNWSGVSAVSMSWGADELSSDSSNDFHFTTPSGHTGVTFLASSGDNGAYSDSSSTSKIVGYPAASNNVIAVGGTRLSTSSGAWTNETGWGYGTSSYNSGGSGGGISRYHTQPTYQKGVVTQSTTFRTLPDVSMDADPATGVPVYSAYDNGSSTPWVTLGGTSLAAPMWAGVIAVANQGRRLSGLSNLNGVTQALPLLYSAPSSDFHDITSGSNGYAAGTGYDLVTGLGTPRVNLLVKDLIGITTPTPAIGSLAISPTAITVGATSVTLTASSVAEIGGTGTIASVKFYRETNGSSGLQTTGTTDTLVGTGTANGTTYTLATPTGTLAIGTYTYYAVATDTAGKTSAVPSATLTVSDLPAPTIGSLAINPSSMVVGAATATLTAGSVAVGSGSISSVKFYRESNATSGLQTTGTTDTLIGTGSVNGSTWAISTTTGNLAIGTYTYYAIATASNGKTVTKSVTLSITATPSPTISAFSVSPATIGPGATIALSAGGVTESGGTIASVKFYRESNATTGLQTTGTTDTLVGNGASSGSTYSLSNVSTAGLGLGTYTYYAIATDTAGKTAVKSATLTIANTSSTGSQLAWNMYGQTAFGTQGLTATTIGGNVTNSIKLTRGSGVLTTGAAVNNGWGGKNWAAASATAISGSQFITFGLTVKTGTTLSLTSIDLNYRRSGAGPTNGLWQYQLGSGAWTTVGDYAGLFASTVTTGVAMTQIKLSALPSLQGIKAGTAINFRLVPYGAGTSGGTFYIYDGTANHNDLVLAGTSALSAAFAPATANSSPPRAASVASLLQSDSTTLQASFWMNRSVFSNRIARLLDL